MSGLDQLRSHRIGLALSGGSVRGIAHIGVAKALDDHGIRPSVITGTSAGSLVGAALAAGMSWRQIEQMAQSIFWPRLLHGRTLERFCSKYLPGTFAELEIPFIAIATELPARRVLAIAEGNLASAISASCAMPGVRRAVNRAGEAAQRWRYYLRPSVRPLQVSGSGVHHRRRCLGSELTAE
jgi:NTE family protein